MNTLPKKPWKRKNLVPMTLKKRHQLHKSKKYQQKFQKNKKKNKKAKCLIGMKKKCPEIQLNM